MKVLLFIVGAVGFVRGLLGVLLFFLFSWMLPAQTELRLGFAVLPQKGMTENKELIPGWSWVIQINTTNQQLASRVQNDLYHKISDYLSLVDSTQTISVMKDWIDGKPFLRSTCPFVSKQNATDIMEEVRKLTVTVMDRSVENKTLDEYIQGTKVV